MPEHMHSQRNADEVRAEYVRLIGPLLEIEKKQGVFDPGDAATLKKYLLELDNFFGPKGKA
eukprot:115934-Rhodomonas_salina.1